VLVRGFWFGHALERRGDCEAGSRIRANRGNCRILRLSGECRGLSVRDKSRTGFAVKELEAGTSSVAFSYRIVALRQDMTAPRLQRATLPEAPVAIDSSPFSAETRHRFKRPRQQRR